MKTLRVEIGPGCALTIAILFVVVTTLVLSGLIS